jgi:hypothetical protein
VGCRTLTLLFKHEEKEKEADARGVVPEPAIRSGNRPKRGSSHIRAWWPAVSKHCGITIVIC